MDLFICPARPGKDDVPIASGSATPGQARPVVGDGHQGTATGPPYPLCFVIHETTRPVAGLSYPGCCPTGRTLSGGSPQVLQDSYARTPPRLSHPGQPIFALPGASHDPRRSRKVGHSLKTMTYAHCPFQPLLLCSSPAAGDARICRRLRATPMGFLAGRTGLEAPRRGAGGLALGVLWAWKAE